MVLELVPDEYEPYALLSATDVSIGFGHGPVLDRVSVRVTKPWTWDESKKACVGSFEYWQGVKGYKPEWQSAGKYDNETVPLDKALSRCAEIGRTVSDNPPPRREPPPVTGAADRIRRSEEHTSELQSH